MHFVLAPVGSRGDVQPALALAYALRARGHTVVICAGAHFRPWVQAHGFAFHASGIDAYAILRETAGDVTARPLKLLQYMNERLPADLEREYDELLAGARGGDMIIGAGIQFSAGSVAEALGIPYRYTLYAPHMIASQKHPPPIFGRTLSLPPAANRALWWTFGKVYNRLLGPTINRLRARAGLRPIDNVMRYMAGERPVLASDPALMPMPPGMLVTPTQTGAWFIPDEEPLAPEVEEFLQAGPPPLYFGFGSMTDARPAETTGMVCDAVAAAGQRVIVSAGWADFGREALPPHALAVGQVNHARLFRRVRAVIHHGGAGTVAACARAGAVQIVVPHIVDQFLWGARVHTLGVGPAPIRRARLTRARLERAIGEACGRPLYAERAKMLARQMRQDGIERAADWFVAEVASAKKPRAARRAK